MKINTEYQPGKIGKTYVFLFGIMLASFFVQDVFGQSSGLAQVIQLALKNNEGIKSANYQIDYYQQIRKTSTDIGKLSAVWMHGQYNSAFQDNNFTVTQTIPFPTAMTSQSTLGREEVLGAQKNLVVTKNELVFEVKSVYYQLLYLESIRKLLNSQDSLYNDFSRAATSRFNAGESNLLEKTTAETQRLDSKNQLQGNASDIIILQTRLQALLKSERPVIADEPLQKKIWEGDTLFLTSNPQLNYLRQQATIGEYVKKAERNKMLPDLTFGYFNQSLVGYQNIYGTDQYYGKGKHFQGFQIGVLVPLWLTPQLAKVKASAYREASLRKNAEYYETTLRGFYSQAIQELRKNKVSLSYFEDSGLKNSALILSQAQKAYAGGEIGYFEFLQSLKTVIGIRNGYLAALNQYNQSVIKLEYLCGNY